MVRTRRLLDVGPQIGEVRPPGRRGLLLARLRGRRVSALLGFPRFP
jgi:hypothetical protein